MAGIDEINNKILQDARDDARERLEKATEKAGKIIESARQEAEGKARSILAKAERDAAEYLRRAMALADIEIRKEKLEIKQQLLQKAYARTEEMLRAIPDEEYCRLMAGIIVQMPGDEKYGILLSKKDRERIGKRLEDTVSQLAREMGLQVEARLLDSDADISGGFILRTPEMEFNYSIESLMRSESENLEKLFWEMQ